MRQFETAHNMTDQFGALSILSFMPGDQREQALETFYRTHAADHLVVDKWFALQGLIPEASTYERVRRLMEHHAFTYANPNRLRSLIGSFIEITITDALAHTLRGEPVTKDCAVTH
jgi:aminopeptidase N